jgi:hypothetical protein
MKARGVDEAIQAIEELREAISPETLVRWADIIQQTARKACGQNVAFKGTIDADGKFRLETDSTSETFECLIEAIRESTLSMHKATKAFYENVIYSLIAEKDKKLAPVQQEAPSAKV